MMTISNANRASWKMSIKLMVLIGNGSKVQENKDLQVQEHTKKLKVTNLCQLELTSYH